MTRSRPMEWMSTPERPVAATIKLVRNIAKRVELTLIVAAMRKPEITAMPMSMVRLSTTVITATTRKAPSAVPTTRWMVLAIEPPPTAGIRMSAVDAVHWGWAGVRNTPKMSVMTPTAAKRTA